MPKFAGHPLCDELPPKADRAEFFKKYNLDKNKKLVAIFPGSRKFELARLTKTFLQAKKLIEKDETRRTVSPILGTCHDESCAGQPDRVQLSAPTCQRPYGSIGRR